MELNLIKNYKNDEYIYFIDISAKNYCLYIDFDDTNINLS